MKVKGSILVEFVRTIRADKSGAYDSYLTDADRKILGQRILPSGWYPYETFKNCFNAVFQILAKGDTQTVRKWGHTYGESIMGGIYKGLLKKGEPMEYLKKYPTYLRNFFDFGNIEIKQVSDNVADLSLEGFEIDFEPLYYMMLGWLERTLEVCGAREIEVENLEEAYEGGPATKIRLSWKI